MKKRNWFDLLFIIAGYTIAALGVIAAGISFGFLLIIRENKGMIESAALLLFSTLLWEVTTKVWEEWLNGKKER